MLGLVFFKARYWAQGYYFSIYVNDLPEVPSSGNLEMFADDTTSYCSGDSVDDVCANIQSSLEEIAKWCNRNYLTEIT